MDIRECIDNLIANSKELYDLLQDEAHGDYDSGYCTECMILGLDIIDYAKKIGRFKETWLK